MELFGFAIPMMFFIFLFSGVFLFILNIVTSIWAYRDALRKGKSKEYSLIVLVATIFFPVVGLIIYILIRND